MDKQARVRLAEMVRLLQYTGQKIESVILNTPHVTENASLKPDNANAPENHFCTQCGVTLVLTNVFCAGCGVRL